MRQAAGGQHLQQERRGLCGRFGCSDPLVTDPCRIRGANLGRHTEHGSEEGLGHASLSAHQQTGCPQQGHPGEESHDVGARHMGRLQVRGQTGFTSDESIQVRSVSCRPPLYQHHICSLP